MRARSARNNNRILHDKLNVGDNFAGSTTKADARSVCGSSLFTRKYIIAQADIQLSDIQLSYTDSLQLSVYEQYGLRYRYIIIFLRLLS